MTFESTPPTYSSVNDALVYVVYDVNAADPVNYPNYKYRYEIWINGVNQFQGPAFPQPDNNRGIIDGGSIIRQYVNASLKAELGEGEFSISVVIKIREEYNGSIGAVVLTDSTRVFFNHYNGRINDFTILGTYANKVASTRPTTIYMPANCTTYYLPYFATTTTGISLNINGVASTLTPTANNTMQNINIAANATADYSVVIGSQTYNVVIVCGGIYKNYILHFLNQFGGYESMLFNKANKITKDIERKTYQQLPYRVSSAGVVSVKSGSIMHPQKSTFASRYTEKLKVMTDWLTDVEHDWLFQLVVSPDIYLQDGSTLYPITLTDTNYDVKQYNIDKLSTLSLNIEFGTSYKTQYR
jgi:hypothetical protein